MIKSTDLNQKKKVEKAAEVCDRFVKKLKNPKELTGEQFWKLHKGDNKGEDIPIDFIENYAEKNKIKLDREGFDKIFIDETENSLKNLKHTRKKTPS